VVAGIFGGVLGGISFAIISDLFKMEVRGRVMGFVQMAPGLAQVLGFPLALVAANYFSWHAAFWLIVIIAVIYTMIALIYLKPINEHLKNLSQNNAITHLLKTFIKPNYLLTYASSMALMLAVWMILPFNTVFINKNVGVSMTQLPYMYLISGIFTFTSAPFIGKWADRYGKYRVFVIVSLLSLIIIPAYTHLTLIPFWLLIIFNILFFTMLGARMISLNALITGIPQPQDRGAFMSINASIQQVAGGIAAGLTGIIVTQAPDGKILNYNILGYCLMGTVLLVLLLAYFVNELILNKNLAPVGKL
jgi:predicted MFS family arabinose efflux permease